MMYLLAAAGETQRIRGQTVNVTEVSVSSQFVNVTAHVTETEHTRARTSGSGAAAPNTHAHTH